MVKKRVTRSWSKHNVPMEIWSEILARLPVRSLVRFRRVSRSWKTVIDDPDFCREHLERFKNNCDDTHLLMVQGGGVEYCFVLCSDTMKASRWLGSLGRWDETTREWESTATPGFNGLLEILFSVDGLVMLKYYDGLMLWNPSIRRCRLVPDSHGKEFLELGLGFDPLIRDYKLVRVSRNTPSSVSIYTVGTSSWKTVAAQGALPSTWLETASERGSRSIYFKGCLYILSYRKLISFNLTKEVFKSVDLSGYMKSAREYIGDPVALVDMGSSLAVLHYRNYRSHRGSIWVLDDNAAAASSWTMRCTFAMDGNDFLYLKKNGDLLFNSYMRHMVSYNIHTDEKKILLGFPKIITRVLGYKESLVLLK